jgi:hypothetical protein
MCSRLRYLTPADELADRKDGILRVRQVLLSRVLDYFLQRVA